MPRLYENRARKYAERWNRKNASGGFSVVPEKGWHFIQKNGSGPDDQKAYSENLRKAGEASSKANRIAKKHF